MMECRTSRSCLNSSMYVVRVVRGGGEAQTVGGDSRCVGNELRTYAAYAYVLLNVSMDFSSQTYVNVSAKCFDNYAVVFISGFYKGLCCTSIVLSVSIYSSFIYPFLPLCLLQDYQEKIGALEGTIQQLQEEAGLRGRLSEETQDSLKRYVHTYVHTASVITVVQMCMYVRMWCVCVRVCVRVCVCCVCVCCVCVCVCCVCVTPRMAPSAIAGS